MHIAMGTMLLGLAPGPGWVGADTVTLRDGVILRDVRVEEIRTNAVTLGSGEPVPLADVRRMVFDRFSVPGKSSGLVMTDGTTMNGRILQSELTRIEFRSSTLGRLTIPVDKVAGVFYGGRDQLPPRWPSVTQPLLMQTGAADPERSGRVLWYDAESVGFMGAQGLERIPVQRVNVLILRTVAARNVDRVLLRNGDILMGPFEYAGKSLSFTAFERKHLLPLRAVNVLMKP